MTVEATETQGLFNIALFQKGLWSPWGRAGVTSWEPCCDLLGAPFPLVPLAFYTQDC